MKIRIQIVHLVFILLFLVTHNSSLIAQTPEWRWANNSDGSNNNFANAIASDAFGNIYSVGGFSSMGIIFDTTSLANARTGSPDIFIAKYDTSGVLTWAKRAGGTKGDEATSITTDASGNIYIAGGFDSPIILFDSTELINSASKNMFIVKYNTDGKVLWAETANGSINNEAKSVIVDNMGNVYVTGFFWNSISFDSITLTSTSDYANIFIVKYDKTGKVKWAKTTGGSNNNDIVWSIKTDKKDNLYIAGSFASDSLSFSSITLYNTSPGMNDIFLVKCDTAGNEIWAKTAVGIGSDVTYSISVDLSDNIYVTGSFNSPSLVFDSYTLTNSSPWLLDIFLAKYNSDGKLIWAKSLGGSGDDYANSISKDASGNVFIAGYFNSPSITFGSKSFTNSGSKDIFVVGYNTYGNIIWAKTAGGISDDYIKSITVDVSGNIYVNGYFASKTMTLGSYILTLGTSGNVHMFVAKLNSPNQPLVVQPPRINDGFICFSGSTSVYASGAFAEEIYKWYDSPVKGNLLKSDTAKSNNYISEYITPFMTQNYIYYVSLDSAGRESVRIPVTVYILTHTEISYNLVNKSFCEGTNAVLTMRTKGQNVRYFWTKDNVIIPGATSTSITLFNFSKSDEALYYCYAYNGCDTAKTKSLLTIKYPPYINTAQIILYKNIGDSVVYDISPSSGTPPFYYQWQRNNIDITAATNNIFIIDSIVSSDNGNYSCVISNSCSKFTTEVSTLNVIEDKKWNINGNFVYDDNQLSPIIADSIKVIIKNSEGIVIDQCFTVNGNFVFSNLPQDNYIIEASFNKEGGGYDPLDALLINRNYIGFYDFSDSLYKIAADVNRDYLIDPGDALLLNRRYISSISAFPIDNWVFESQNITLDNNISSLTIKTLCTGDVNGSYFIK